MTRRTPTDEFGLRYDAGGRWMVATYVVMDEDGDVRFVVSWGRTRSLSHARRVARGASTGWTYGGKRLVTVVRRWRRGVLETLAGRRART